MKTQSRAAQPPELPDNPWRPMEEAPKDRVIVGQFTDDDETGAPIYWRTSRRREKGVWVDGGGVWHSAFTAGSVQVKPIAWREYEPVGLHFAELGQPPVAA